jgi:ethanolamine ammonia-lyase large subunit
MDNLLVLLGAAGCTYLMGVPGADDIMLNYQSTSYHDVRFLQTTLGLRPAPEFEAWLQTMGITEPQGNRLAATGYTRMLTGPLAAIGESHM